MTGDSNIPYVANLVNSIIGVSVLAMPFCMKKCGLVLGLSLLLGAAWLTYVSCSMLVSAAVQKRRRTYEYLALYTVGTAGKFAVELSMIGLMLGTCVAFYVVIGDLATGILSSYVESEIHKLRTFVIVFCALCIALPLGLMKNLAALGKIGVFSLVFYMLFVFVMLLNSINNGMLKFDWINKVELFRPAGVFQCLPIFSLAYACQCQLFVVYDSLEDPSILRMDKIVTNALKIVTTVYCLVAVFGYATFTDEVYGNVLQNFKSSVVLELIKLGFAVSVVVGFPLMIFPCRQSIHTLFFRQQLVDGTPSKSYIDPFTFKAITLCIVLSTMCIAILIPNVETILGLTGATMGSFICFIFPAIIFSKASPKGDTTISKFVFGIGCLLLIVCTYSNVFIASETDTRKIAVQQPVVVVDKLDVLELPVEVDVDKNPVENNEKDDDPVLPDPTKPPIAEAVDDEHRHEPANPMEPIPVEGGDDSPQIKEEEQHLEEQKYLKEENVAKEEEVIAENKENVNEPENQIEKVDSVLEKAEVKDEEVILTEVKVDQENVKKEGQENVVINNEPVAVIQPEKEIENQPIENEFPVKDNKPEDAIDQGNPQLQDIVKDKMLEPPVPNINNKDQDAEIKLNKEEDNLKNQNLLVKIKKQHKKQHELLQEQEQLIQALEEQQEKEGVKGEEKINDEDKQNIAEDPKKSGDENNNLSQNNENKIEKPVFKEQKVVVQQNENIQQPKQLEPEKKPEPIQQEPIKKLEDSVVEQPVQVIRKELDPERQEREIDKPIEKKESVIFQKEPDPIEENKNHNLPLVENMEQKQPEKLQPEQQLDSVVSEEDNEKVDKVNEEIIEKKPNARDLKSVLLEETA